MGRFESKITREVIHSLSKVAVTALIMSNI